MKRDLESYRDLLTPAGNHYLDQYASGCPDLPMTVNEKDKCIELYGHKILREYEIGQDLNKLGVVDRMSRAVREHWTKT